MSSSSEEVLNELLRRQVMCQPRNFKERQLFYTMYQKSKGISGEVSSYCGCLCPPFGINVPTFGTE